MGANVKRVLVIGALGKMGEQVRSAVDAREGLVLGGALEAPGHTGLGTKLEEGVVVTDDVGAALEGCDVAIDFSIPKATLANASAAADRGVAYVTGTTGFSPAEFETLLALGERTALLHANNFSVAVNVLGWLAREAAARLGPGFDAELFEMHHAAKRDAPSGTALFLAGKVAEGQGSDLDEKIVLERAGEIGARPDGAIGVQTLRGGDCPGEHTLYLVGRGERIELSHRSFTREHFASGAARCAAWLAGREPGVYSIEEVLGLD
jgi:4-hydroxy-tetrahydrodipicolinate reductase